MKKKNEYYFPVPDNEDSFFAYINLVINNKNNAHIPEGRIEQRPNKVGPVNIAYTHNEVGELFMVTNNFKDYKFLDMICDQFCLLRSHWNMIQSFEQYPYASKY
jgi:hypothetical protein